MLGPGELGVLLFIEPPSDAGKGSVRVLGIYSDLSIQHAEYDRLKARYPEHRHLIFTDYVKLNAPAKTPF